MLNKLAGRTALAVALIVVGASTAQAQVPGRDPMAGVAAGANKMMVPAQWVLSHKQELSLSADQVKQLETLARAGADSQKARMERIQKSGTVARGAAMAQAMQEWAGPIDEKGMRQLSAEQSQFQADLMIGLVRDRRAVGKVLTDAQRAQLPALERKDMMAMMNR